MAALPTPNVTEDWGDDLNAAIEERAVPTGGATGQVLTKASDSDRDVAWTAPSSGVILIDAGASVPPGTAAGTIVFEKGPTTAYAQALTLSPLIALSLDETSGTFADAGSNGAAFTAGAGVTRGKTPLQGTGFSVSGSGSAEIASLSGTPAALTDSDATVMVVAKFPAANVQGTLIKAGGGSANGWSLDVGGGAGNVPGRSFVIGRNGIAWTATNIAIPSDTPVVVVLSRNSSGDFALYVDGELRFTVNGGINSPSGGGPAVGSGTGFPLSSTVDVESAAWWGGELTEAQVKSMGTGSTVGRARGYWDGSMLRPLR